jgi:hypothetical protein
MFMTKKFDKFILPLLEDMAVASVLGNDGKYESDVRTPKIIIPTMRRRMRKNRRK